MMYRCAFVLLFVLQLCGAARAQRNTSGEPRVRLRDCDLLFQVADVPNAITEVTRGADGLQVEHVGVFSRMSDGSGVVIEALPGQGVVETPLAEFLQRNTPAGGQPAVVVGRVRGRLNRKATLRNVRFRLGCPYDSLYLAANEAVYCSELVQTCYVDRCGRLVFAPIPMTFRDSSGCIPTYWTDFYARHGMEVPEGAPGSNPGELSRRPNVEIQWEPPFRLFP